MEKSIVIFLLVLVLGAVLGAWIAREIAARKKGARLSVSFLESKLSECSDLTTCNLEYVGLVKYENGSIPLLSKKSFSMIYSANVRAGIDLSRAAVTMNDAQVKVKLPDAEIQSIEVDTDGLKFYDEHAALFNWDKKEDISAAVKAARDDVTANAQLDKLKDQAYKQAELVIFKLIQPAVGRSRQLVIVKSDADHPEVSVLPPAGKDPEDRHQLYS